MVKNPPAVYETWVQSPDREDPLETGMATHSSILAERILMDRGVSWDLFKSLGLESRLPRLKSHFQHLL